MIRIQLRFFPNNLPFNLSGVIPCSRPCIECLSIFLTPFFGLLIQHHSALLSVPSTAFSASLFVFQTPFLVQHGLPFFIFRFGIPFSLAFLSFFFLLLAQVLPQFTARYRHDELMSLCNNLFESPVLSMGFARIIKIIIIYSIHRALIPNGPKALEWWCNTWLYKKSSDRLIFIIRSHGSSSTFPCRSIRWKCHS